MRLRPIWLGRAFVDQILSVEDYDPDLDIDEILEIINGEEEEQDDA